VNNVARDKLIGDFGIVFHAVIIPMSIKFHCPSCAVSISAPANAAGRQSACPKCGAKVLVPSVRAKPLASPPSPSYHGDPPPFIEGNLAPGENIVYIAHVHPATWLVPLCVLLGLFVLFALLSLANRQIALLYIGLLFLVSAVVATLYELLVIAFTEFVVTDRRIVAKTGILYRNLIEILRGKVESIEVNQNLFGMMFGYGTVTISGTGSGKTAFSGIAAPFECRIAVEQLVRI
jgi:DNA-directed RNA polymerase subunit RPC12/RpoP